MLSIGWWLSNVAYQKCICQYDGKYANFLKYMPIFETVTERNFRKNPKQANALGDGPAFWISPGICRWRLSWRPVFRIFYPSTAKSFTDKIRIKIIIVFSQMVLIRILHILNAYQKQNVRIRSIWSLKKSHRKWLLEMAKTKECQDWNGSDAVTS